MRGESGIYVSDGVLCNEATRVGIPALTFEVGEGGRLEEDSVATGARCVLNLLRFLNMIDADIKKPVTTQVMREFLGLRARCGGLLITEAELREALRSGDVLCRIIDIFQRGGRMRHRARRRVVCPCNNSEYCLGRRATSR